MSAAPHWLQCREFAGFSVLQLGQRTAFMVSPCVPLVGVASVMGAGVLIGFPIVDVKFTLTDGAYHDVDSSVLAFEIAGRAGFREALQKAAPRILEPIMRVEVVTPEDYVGDVIGDLNSRRGHPLGMEPKGGAGMTEIVAEVPMAEVLDYAPALRAVTGGRGDYTLEFDRHEEVPGHLAEKVIADARAADGQAVA